jgi:hypothetical protein
MHSEHDCTCSDQPQTVVGMGESRYIIREKERKIAREREREKKRVSVRVCFVCT